MLSSSDHLHLAFLAIFLILQPIAAIDILSPFLSPVIDEVCKEVECGKGKCKASVDFSFNFICECEPGWKHSFLQDDNNHLRFLPCVIPNCTLDYSCTNAAPRVPEVKEPPLNKSFFDPCYWAYCGEGSCTKLMKLGYKCECQDGYANLLNVTAFPCFRECTLGANCAGLGITVSNNSANTTPNLDGNGENHASSILHSNFPWLTILVTTVAFIGLK